MADTDAPQTPAEFIQREIAKLGISQKDLASALGIPASSVSQIVVGRRGITAEMACGLSAVFDVTPEFILGLQKAAELRAELAKAKPISPMVAKNAKLIARNAKINATYPVREMVKRGWIDDDRSTFDAQLAKFFGVETADDVPHLAHAGKKSDYSEIPPAQLAWIFRVKQVAAGMLVAQFSETSARDAARRLAPLRAKADDARGVPRIMSEAGIRFVIIESLPSAKIDGVCMWLNDSEPVIGLSMRHDRIDNFWFVLRHELEHVIQGHGRTEMMLDVDLDGRRDIEPDEERIANEAAAGFCVPPEMMAKFVARKSPFFADRDIIAFAHMIGVHPGLVAGQLQRLTSRYDRFRAHQVKVRSLITPGSITDGWGDVAPIEP